MGDRSLSLLATVLFNATVSDVETGYKVIDRKVLDGLDLRADRFDFEPEITAKLLRRGHRIYEVPVTYAGRRPAGGPQVHLARRADGGVDARTAALRLDPGARRAVGRGAGARPGERGPGPPRRQRRRRQLQHAGTLLVDCVAGLRGEGVGRRGRGRQRLDRRLPRGADGGGPRRRLARLRRQPRVRPGRQSRRPAEPRPLPPGLQSRRRASPRRGGQLGRRPRRRRRASGSSDPGWSTPTGACTPRPALSPPCSTPSATARSASSGRATRSAAGTSCWTGTTARAAGSTGCRARCSWSGGRRGRSSAASIRATSCTWRTSTCAGGPGGPGGGWATSRPPRSPHVQGVVGRPASVPDDRRPPPLALALRPPLDRAAGAGCCCPSCGRTGRQDALRMGHAPHRGRPPAPPGRGRGELIPPVPAGSRMAAAD